MSVMKTRIEDIHWQRRKEWKGKGHDTHKSHTSAGVEPSHILGLKPYSNMYAKTLRTTAGLALTLHRSRALRDAYIVWLELLVEEFNEITITRYLMPNRVVQTSVDATNKERTIRSPKIR